ncbi:MAG: Clp protease N-terminal domain-containing protein [Gaiellaceae bacterium]
MLDRGFDEARELGDEYVSVEHLLLALELTSRGINEVRGSQRVTGLD